MTIFEVQGLVLAFGSGVVVGLLLAWVVIPGIVDVWVGGLRHRNLPIHRRRRDR